LNVVTHLLGFIDEAVVEKSLNDTSGSALQSREDPSVVDTGMFADTVNEW
jgi:hypothetical protein